MTAINIIDKLDQINFGIWNAAISTASILHEKYGVISELWHPKTKFKLNSSSYKSVIFKEVKKGQLSDLLKQYNHIDTIIISHGCWRYSTHWGKKARLQGFNWIYVPHGMLEPWSLKKKAFKKKIYFHFIEKKLARKASLVRAVGAPEFQTLSSYFNKLTLIPNGIASPSYSSKDKKRRVYLFMGRLHEKKQVTPLVEAWSKSRLKNKEKSQLIIAGPDHGEQKKIHQIIKKEQIQNIELVGAIYGEDKFKLLRNSHFFVLPSLSEGFPTSVVEGAGYGLIPIVSEGCNFPELFAAKLGINSGFSINEITEALNESDLIGNKGFTEQSKACHSFIYQNYGLNKIAHQQKELYDKLLK